MASRILRCARAKLALAAVAALLSGLAGAGEKSWQEPQHLGVASCAASTCHGKIRPDADSPVALNEYFIWSKYDSHSQANKLLKSAWSRRIAANMELGEPTAAQVCLTCHTDNVPPARRGARFQTSDGIGCEACHGGAQAWIDSHHDPSSTRAENLQRGMLPTWQPLFQGRLCQSCHLGDADHYITHEMMAAGHPRLRFELDTWLANMPPHHVEDEDYHRRNGQAGNIDRWAAGLVTAADAYLNMLAQHIDSGDLVPEFALFDCHACHRPVDTGVTRSALDKSMTPAGTIRPDDHALGMLGLIVALRSERLAGELQAGIQALHRAAAQSANEFRKRAAGLRGSVQRAGDILTRQPISAEERANIRRTLLRAAANGQFRDYADAEQLYLALQALAAQAGGSGSSQYERMFDLLDNEQGFDPAQLAQAAHRLLDH